MNGAIGRPGVWDCRRPVSVLGPRLPCEVGPGRSCGSSWERLSKASVCSHLLPGQGRLCLPPEADLP